MSFVMQQTSRTVKEHSSDISEDENTAIDAVFEYDKIASVYDPRISDPVKALYKNPSEEQLKEYYRVWAEMFFKYPASYISATVNQNYYLVYPFVENDSIHKSFNWTSVYYAGSWERLKEVLQIEDRQAEPLKNSYAEWTKAMYHIPLVALLSNPALYVLVLLVTIALAAAKKRYSYLIPALPLFICAIGIIFAPAIQRHPRYLFPVIYSMPLMIAYFTYLNNKD